MHFVPSLVFHGIVRCDAPFFFLFIVQRREVTRTLQRRRNPIDKIGKQILQYGTLLKGFPNYPSLHPCSTIITDKPITEYGTLFMPPKGFPGLQMDMFTAEEVGLNKFDILSQRSLSHIRTAMELVMENNGPVRLKTYSHH
jgi:DNA polymerase-3 subunit alpha